jgi:Flp pilus assembly protein TadG
MSSERPLLRLGVAARDRRGASAIEFAILAPAFIALTVGVLNLALMLFTLSSMHYATEAAARCASVQTTLCTGPSAIQTEAANRYYGPQLGQVFTYAAAGCGNRVTGTVTYVLNAGVYQWSVPLSATSCFP